ncbi:class III lanthionine synthetase LanKC [Streptomyces monticola]|uniref:non-specific serine/threonine protein kinase n=1 Tax=Streptomyces monticola TaxID=2666263 RepID=A0ABW2JSE9_9ACTN
MDKRYEVYCLADRHFYETPDRLASAQQPGVTPKFSTAERPVPESWKSSVNGDWLMLTPLDGDGQQLPLPAQGWKIHVSATRENADKVASVVWDYCVPRGVPFKFVPGPVLLHLRNSKYAARDGSGKFATIYPTGEEQLQQILRELGKLLEGHEGPYILTDLRWDEGPLYVRYGAFARRMCVDKRGTLVPALENAEGVLVPDKRDPAFRVPEWVKLPAFLEPQLAARNTTTVGDLPYRIEKALHFSNGGGVYRGTDTRTGRKVVLKEARPHAGLGSDGADAVTRLERERTALERAAGLAVAPEPLDWFLLGDHQFLVMEYIEGRTLNSFFAERHPLLSAEPSRDAIAEYTEWALRIHGLVEQAVEALHGRGVVFNDLHMFNILIAPDEQSVTLIDFETAADAEEDGRQVVAHPGFVAPADRRGADVDRYALACLRIALFMPVTTLFAVDRGKAAHLADVVAAEFPDVPREFLDTAVAEICRGYRAPDGAAQPAAAEAPASGLHLGGATPVAEPGDWPYSRDSMAKAILAAATPERDDRLFPGDIAQFTEGGGLGLAHGAAGVLYALAQTGAERYEEGEEWLLAHTDPVPFGTPLGLYDGIAGIAYTLHRLGHTQRALDLVEFALREKWQRLTTHLHGGLAGLGLVLDHLAWTAGESQLNDLALEATEIVASRVAELRDGDRAGGKGRRAGLMHGMTGPALLLIRQYEATGAPELLELAGDALRLDLECCVEQKGGGLQVNEGWRTMPYVGDGSAGIGMVLDDYLTHQDDDAFELARDGILTAATSRFYAQPGLLQGRAGMILHLSRTTMPEATSGQLAAQIAALGWLAMPYAGQLAFPGHQMMRLSMDLATGTVGCLLALGAALDSGSTAQLPFLPPLRRRP